MVLVAQGCARSRSAASAEAGASSAAAPEQPVAETAPVDEQQPAGGPSTDRQPAAVGSSGLLAYRPLRRLLPEDAMIGPLADELNAAAGERAALIAVERLLAAVRSGGDLSDAPLSAAARVHVAASIGHHLRRGVTLSSFRLGMVERTGDTAFLRARLSGPLGSVPAELYLIQETDIQETDIQETDRWLVDDLQADWAALQRSQPAPDPIPLPRPHGWTWF